MSDSGVYQALRFRTARQGGSSGLERFLSASRLELLPQLVNVVHGDISIAKVLD
jgi:lipopolysaccharide/colanic/teichoic acid biosynthesis glycosyltransferase